ATGGSETHTLQSSQVPATSVTVSITDPGHTHTVSPDAIGTNTQGVVGGSGIGPNGTSTNQSADSNTTGITASGTVQGGGCAHNNVQPTIIANKIIYAGVYS